MVPQLAQHMCHYLSDLMHIHHSLNSLSYYSNSRWMTISEQSTLKIELKIEDCPLHTRGTRDYAIQSVVTDCLAGYERTTQGHSKAEL